MSSATEQELIVCVSFGMYLHMYCALECQCSNCLHVLWFSAVLIAVSHCRESTAPARTVARYPGSAVLCSLAGVAWLGHFITSHCSCIATSGLNDQHYVLAINKV